MEAALYGGHFTWPDEVVAVQPHGATLHAHDRPQGPLLSATGSSGREPLTEGAGEGQEAGGDAEAGVCGGELHGGGLAVLLQHLRDTGQLDEAPVGGAEAEAGGQGHVVGGGCSTHSAPQLVPLLSRFGLSVALQAAAAEHPRLPAVRLRVEASPLHVHFSPWRFHGLMRVIAGLSPAPADGAAASGVGAGAGGKADGGGLTGGPELPLWVTDAEYSTPVQVGVRGGTDNGVQQFCPGKVLTRVLVRWYLVLNLLHRLYGGVWRVA